MCVCSDRNRECVEIESACKGSGRECACLEREREMGSVCRER